MYLYLFIPIFTVFSYLESPKLLNTEDKEGTYIIEGKYLDQNVYLQNSICNSGIGYCAYEVRVNGELLTENIQSNSFEIDFNNIKIDKGDDVFIEVKHQSKCQIKLLNPDALIPDVTFDLVDIKITNDGMLKWSTINESYSMPFIIQQHRWNKWQNIGEVNGYGKSVLTNYSFKVDFNSGENEFRVVQKRKNDRYNVSEVVCYNNPIPKLNFTFNKSKREIIFSEYTKYEIHNEYGVLLKRGYDNIVDVKNLANGDYWLSYDNFTEKFKKK